MFRNTRTFGGDDANEDVWIEKTRRRKKSPVSREILVALSFYKATTVQRRVVVNVGKWGFSGQSNDGTELDF